jgi:hypothetical protein
MLDSTHVGVAATEKDIAKGRFFGSSAFDSVVDVMDLGLGISKVAPGECWEGMREVQWKCYKQLTYILHQWAAD